jgi:hypothetical protein
LQERINEGAYPDTERAPRRSVSHMGKFSGDSMHYLTKEKTKVLAEKNGWSLAHAEGFVDGEAFRRRGLTPSKHAQVGIDDYSLGFRAGYYERRIPDPASAKSPVVLVNKLPADAPKSVQEL